MPLGNSIGPHYVRNWFGAPPQRMVESTEILSYAGNDYQAIRKLGIRSPIFQMQSVVDVFSSATGRNLFAQYCNMVGIDVYQLFWNNWNLDTENQRVIVLDCRIIELQRKLQICGSLNGYLVDLRVDWTLMLTPYFP
jgi:hypothetical protein